MTSGYIGGVIDRVQIVTESGVTGILKRVDPCTTNLCVGCSSLQINAHFGSVRYHILALYPNRYYDL